MANDKLYFIVNEKSKSGNGTSVWTQIETYLNANQIEYNCWRTDYQGHAGMIAGEISRIDEPEKRLIVIGGDGTINEVLNGMTDFERISLGVIPNGSGNDFVRGLGTERHPIKYLKKVLNQKSDYWIDLGQVQWDGCEQPRLFGISSGVGMDALVCKLTETTGVKSFLNRLHLGKLTYLVLTIYALFSMDTTNGVLEYNEQKKTMNKVIFSAVMNFPAEGGGVPMAPKASARDGLLSVCCAANISKWKTFFYLPFLVAAKHGNFKKIQLFDTDELNWKFDKPVTLHTDGEYCGEAKEVTFKCLERKLRILI